MRQVHIIECVFLINESQWENMPNILDKFLDVDKSKYNFLQLEQISRHK